MDDLRKFARYFLPYKVELTLGIACIVASVVFNLYIPIIVGHAIDANWVEITWSRLTISALKVLWRQCCERHLSFSSAAHPDWNVAQG